jgi:thiol-disulfide isomerase/thioredoxin
MVRHRWGVLAALGGLLLTGLATGCAPGAGVEVEEPLTVPSLGPSSVKADTPELQAAKEQAGIEDCQPGSGKAVPDGPPDLTLPCLGGGPDVNLSTLRGPLVINTWGAWCDPCREELPILADFYEEYGDRVAMLGIDFQDTRPDEAIELAANSGVTYPQLFDHQGQVLRTTVLAGTGVPSLAFVDENGEVVAWVAVVINSEQELIDLVEEHLGLAL